MLRSCVVMDDMLKDAAGVDGNDVIGAWADFPIHRNICTQSKKYMYVKGPKEGKEKNKTTSQKIEEEKNY